MKIKISSFKIPPFTYSDRAGGILTCKVCGGENMKKETGEDGIARPAGQKPSSRTSGTGATKLHGTEGSPFVLSVGPGKVQVD